MVFWQQRSDVGRKIAEIQAAILSIGAAFNRDRKCFKRNMTREVDDIIQHQKHETALRHVGSNIGQDCCCEIAMAGFV
ncbi:hypothetical protein [Devosia indica]